MALGTQYAPIIWAGIVAGAACGKEPPAREHSEKHLGQVLTAPVAAVQSAGPSAGGQVADIRLSEAERIKANALVSATEWLRALSASQVSVLVKGTSLPFQYETAAKERNCEQVARTERALGDLVDCLKRSSFDPSEAIKKMGRLKLGWAEYPESWRWAEPRRAAHPDMVWVYGGAEIPGANVDWILGLRGAQVGAFFLSWDIHE